MGVAVVLIHWEQPGACAQTIALFDADPAVGSITVVDNGSSSSALLIVQRALTECQNPTDLLCMGRNTGFGPATNRGFERWLADPTGGEWCFVAPHDAIPAPGTLAAMLSAAAEKQKQGRPGLICADVGDGLTPRVDRNFGPIFTVAATERGWEDCDYPHGTLFMANRACLNEVGLFDERFFTYCEEADLGLRARAAGWDVGLVRGATVENPRVSTPKPVAEYLMERNTLLLVAKHFGALPVAVRATIAVAQLLSGCIRPSQRDEYWSARARVYALRDAARGRWGPPPPSLLN